MPFNPPHSNSPCFLFPNSFPSCLVLPKIHRPCTATSYPSFPAACLRVPLFCRECSPQLPPSRHLAYRQSKHATGITRCLSRPKGSRLSAPNSSDRTPATHSSSIPPRPSRTLLYVQPTRQSILLPLSSAIHEAVRLSANGPKVFEEAKVNGRADVYFATRTLIDLDQQSTLPRS